MRRRFRAFVVAGPILAVAACGTLLPPGPTVARQLVGVSALELRRCLGPPHQFDQVGASEYAYYHHEYAPHFDAVVVYQLPRARRARPPRNHCEYLFRLQGGRVTGLGVRGRAADGLQTDDACAKRLHVCLAP